MANYDHEQKTVKKPKDELPLTPHQKGEMVKCALDFNYWANNYAYVQTDKGKQLFKARSYQERMLDGFINQRYNCVLCPRQAGKKFCINTPVLTPKGFVRNGDLNVGDLIYGRNGLPTAVKYISEQSKDLDQYKLIFDNGEEILACAEHLWTVSYGDLTHRKNKGAKEKTLTTEEIINLKNRLGAKSKPENPYIRINDAVEFPSQPVEIDPYVLGLWLGDGTKNSGQITALESDFRFYESVTGETFTEFKLCKELCGRASVNGLVSRLRNINLLNNKHIPMSYVMNSKEVRIALLQGLMDSDGTCAPRGQCEFYQKSKEFCEDFRFLLSSLGVKSRLKSKVVNGDTYHRVSFSVSIDDFHVFKLPRKLERQAKCLNNPKLKRHYITDIIKLNDGEKVLMQCIQVDNDDHLFLCSKSLIPTHNTTISALYLLHTAIFFKDKKIGVTSYKNRNVKDVIDRIKYTYEAMPHWMKPAVTSYNQMTISFTNKSTITGEVTKESTFRGESMAIIFSDELAHVKPRIAEEWWTAILPSLEGSGEDATTKMIIVSTANGTAGKFAEIWFGAIQHINGFNPVEVNWREIPGRTDEYRARMLKKMNKNKYLQEYENAFLSDKGTLIDSAFLESIEIQSPVKQPTTYLDLYVNDMKGRAVAVACDASEGVGKDYHAMQIFDVNTFEQIGEFRNNDMTLSQYTQEIIKTLGMCYKLGAVEVYYTVENNSIGTAVLLLLQNSDSPTLDKATLITHEDSKKIGMPMNVKTKPFGCMKLKDLLEGGKITIKSRNLINELKFFVKSGNSFAAETGLNDDLCMSMVLMMLLLDQLSDFEESAYEKMQELDLEFEGDEDVVGMYF